jgi:CubicO group peptidase (beta-lactamase class C family)
MIAPADTETMPEGAFTRTWERLRAGVADRVSPGFVAGLWDARQPDLFQIACAGRTSYASGDGSAPVEPGTIYDLASLTKVMATSTLAGLLVDRGWLRWDTPLRQVLPTSAGGGVQGWTEVRLDHLLSHSAGFIAWEPLWEKLRTRFEPRPLWQVSVAERQKAMRELVFSIRPDARPGERAVYSDISFLLLGFMLEEVTRLPLDVAVRRFVWQSMGLDGAFFRHVTNDANVGSLPMKDGSWIAPTEDSAWRGGMIRGQVHDDNCWAMGGYGGHAGAFGTIRDVLTFARALCPRADFAGFLSRPTLAHQWTRLSFSRTPGWDTPSGEDSSVGKLFSGSTVGHLGFSGTSLWIDREAGLAVALLSNRVHPTRDNPKMKAFRPAFHTAIRQDLGR